MMPPTESQVESYHKDGYLLGPTVLKMSEVEELRSELDRVIHAGKDQEPGPVSILNMQGEKKPVWQIVNIWQASPAFKRLIENQIIVNWASVLSGGKQLRVWHDQIQYKPSREGGVNHWHQDWPYWPVLSGPHQVSAWVALDRADEENGCMSMVKGSHVWGNKIRDLHNLKGLEGMPNSWDGKKVEISRRIVDVGQVHFHHPMTFHGSPGNPSSRPRRALAIHYMTEQTLFNEGGDHVMKDKITVAAGQKIQGDSFPLVWQEN